MNDWKNLRNYFQTYPPDWLGQYFNMAEYPWSPVVNIKHCVDQFFMQKTNQGELLGKRNKLISETGSLKEGGWWIEESQILKETFIDVELRICIGKGTLIEAGATIKNHSFIAESCEIRQGAYIRGQVYIGPHSVIGHTTEIKNSIFVGHVEAGHFAYIGDSIVGSNVNLGAGTKISNLEFRSLQQKRVEEFPELYFRLSGEKIATGTNKFGAIIGDGAETGCNCVIAPLTILEPECWIAPNLCTWKGLYPKKSFLKTTEDCKNLRR